MTQRLKEVAQSWWIITAFALFAGVTIHREVQISKSLSATRGSGSSKEVLAEDKLKPGMKLELTGLRIGGGKETIDLSGKTTLYVFSPTCHWCSLNEENVKALVQIQGSKFIGITQIEFGMRDYIAQSGIKYPVYAKLDKPLEVRGTPSTITVENGVIQDVMFGAWTPESGNEAKLKRYFPGLVLPGLKGE